MDTEYQTERVSIFRFPFKIPSLHGIRTFGVYFSGILYAAGLWFFIDAVLYSKHSNGSDVHVTFVDWIPFICSTLGTIIVSSIEKNRLVQGILDGSGASGGAGVGLSSDYDGRIAWQARTVLFIGFALLAGGLSGSIVVLIVKFLVRDYTSYPTLGMGVNNVLGNVLVLFSCIVLWIAQNAEDEYSYSLTL